MRVGLVVLTLNAEKYLIKLFDSIDRQSYKVDRKLLIDSDSTDSTIELARKYNWEFILIKKSEFNHGDTRQKGLEYFRDMDIVIFITQDIIFAGEDTIFQLVESFTNNKIGAAYGRQIPHANASAIAAQARLFNYPERSKIKSYQDKDKLGIKTAFMSDSFAAYRVKALASVGGFPHAIVSEDMYVAACLLKKGYIIAYVAEAKVYHSHDYTICQEFKRYFDIGVFQAHESWISEEFGKAEGEGIKLVVNQIKYLYKHNLFLIPKAMGLNVVKLFGYKLGHCEKYLPNALKKILSGQSYYFK